MMTMNATTTTPTSAFSWSSKTRSPKPLSRSPPDQTQTQSTRGNRRKRRRKRKEKEASPNPLSGNNNAFSSRLLRAGGRARRASFRVTHERERELVFFMRYKPTSLLFFFCFSLCVCIFCPFLYTLNFSFQIVSRGKKETSVQNVHAHAHARGDVNARNATRNRIRERDETRVCTKKRSSLKVEGRVFKKNRERTNTPIPFVPSVKGGDRSNSYILTMVRRLRAYTTNESFSRTHAKSSSPSFPFAFYGGNAFRRTREVFERDLCAQSREACAHSTITLTRLFIFSHF